MKRTRRTFSREYKLAAVNKVIEQGLSYSEIARDLGTRVRKHVQNGFRAAADECSFTHLNGSRKSFPGEHFKPLGCPFSSPPFRIWL